MLSRFSFSEHRSQIVSWLVNKSPKVSVDQVIVLLSILSPELTILSELCASQLVTSGTILTLLRKIQEGGSYQLYHNFECHRIFKDLIHLLSHTVPVVQSSLLKGRP